MEFFSSSYEKRPVRLSEEIRAWAWESMHGKYGDEAKNMSYALPLDHIPDFDKLSMLDRQDIAVRYVAENSPLRHCPRELICGSATLGLGIHGHVPVTYKGESICGAVNHLTICYERVIKEGLVSYKNQLAERLSDPSLDSEQIRFLHSLENVVESMEIWHGRYKEFMKAENREIYELLCQVPMKPARSFHEAVQSLWFVFSFVRLMGNWPGIGRIDEMLGDYLKADIEKGVLTLERAREILASFFIKGCEWIESNPNLGSGDAQHYQNIVLAGVNADGVDITNPVTYLVLDIVEETGISDFPISVRLNKNTPKKLIQKIARIMRHGGGIVAVYNEDLVIEAMVREGYDIREARRFANDGCWEVQVPGATNFAYEPFDALQLFNSVVGFAEEGEIPEFTDVEQVYSAFKEKLAESIDFYFYWHITRYFKEENGKKKRIPSQNPSSVISLFEEDCIKNAAAYYDCGTRYTVISPHIGGAPDVANSLYAIEKAVFEDKKCTWRTLAENVRNNWEGDETLRLFIKNKYTYYGNDSEGADRWSKRIFDDFADIVRARNNSEEVKYIPGVSTFGRQIDWAPKRCATAFGYKKGEILSGNTSPTPGTDLAGATAIIRSYCKADLVKQSCGAALDIKILPETIKGDNGIEALCSLMEGFLSLGGFFMQLDTVDIETLRAAQRDPLTYKTLSVRVSGWNARFVTLNEDWQNMIIERTATGV